MTTPLKVPNELNAAIEKAWTREAARVAQFGLVPILADAKPAASGWAVPVVSDIPTGSAYELTRTLNSLQEIIETESNLSVTLFLDPFAGTQPVFAPKKAG